MSIESTPVPHAFLVPGDDRYTLIDGGRPCTKEQALAALRRSPPNEIRDANEVQLLAFPDDAPPRRLGPVDIRVTPASLGRELASAVMGSGAVTIHMPVGRIK